MNISGEEYKNFLADILVTIERCVYFLNAACLKVGVLSSISDWQEMRALRNIAAHEYGTDYAEIAEHFNTLHSLIPRLYSISKSFIVYCHHTLAIEPSNNDFSDDFKKIVDTYN